MYSTLAYTSCSRELQALIGRNLQELHCAIHTQTPKCTYALTVGQALQGHYENIASTTYLANHW